MMRRNSTIPLILILFGVAIVGTLLTHDPSVIKQNAIAAAPRPFVVFDATLYKDKPSLEAYHVRPITVLYESRLFVTNQSPAAMPPEVIVRSVANELRGTPEPVVLDIERWPFKGDGFAVQATVAKFLSILSWGRDEAPGIRFGIYGGVPLQDYWRAIRDPRSSEYRSWQQDNDRLDAIVDQVDALFPSVYTFYPDRQGWVTYAVAQITEAKRKAKGKPVYAFLMPKYHESNSLLGGKFLDQDYWELELNTVYQYADGVVIWGGWGDTWSEEASWWQVTKRFMQRIDQNYLSPPRDLKVQ